MSAYYNENDKFAAAWLRNLIAEGLIPAGDVDERSIVDVRGDDLKEYAQCHFFAGIGGWAYAARLAGWPDDRQLWTGSCPCQPFSVAGQGKGEADARHLWPEFYRLVRECRPSVVFGEQVAAAVGKSWFDGVFTDLEASGYACAAAVLPACSVGAPHKRERLWFVADASSGKRRTLAQGRGHVADRPDAGREETTGRFELGRAVAMAHPDQPGASEGREQRGGQQRGAGGDPRSCNVGNANEPGLEGRAAESERAGERSPWASGVEWLPGHDGKARRVKSGLRLLAHGVPNRVGKLRAYGNAIVPQVAAEFIAAYCEAA